MNRFSRPRPPKTFGRSASQRPEPRHGDLWLQLVDGGLAGVLFLVPLLMGGRHPLGQLVLVFLAAGTAVAWSVHQWRSPKPQWRPAWAMLLLLAGAGLALLQVLPLPAGVLGWLDPRLAGILPLWNSAESVAGGLGSWHCISMTPADTHIGLALFVAYGLLFLVVVQRVAGVEDVERLLRWCGLAVLGMAVFAFVQFFTSNGKFFWFYQHPFTNTTDSLKGSFSNRNHFAQFLALGMGPLIWWLQDAARRPRGRLLAMATLVDGRQRRELATYLLGLATALVVFASLLSLSRGGMVAALIACTICTLVCYRASAVGGRVLAGLAAAGLVIAASLGVFGYQRLADRLDGVLTGSVEKLDGDHGRRGIWAAAMHAIPDHAVLGAGVGSFQEVYPSYGNPGVDAGLEYTHAESGPLQVAVETGGVGIALLLVGLACCLSWCLRGCSAAAPARLRLCAGALAASLAAFVVHGMVDFVWYVPACAAEVAVLAGCALRIAQSIGQPSAEARLRALPGWVPAAATLGSVALGAWMVAVCLGPAVAAPYWDQYLLALQAAQADLPSTDRHWAASARANGAAREEEELMALLKKVVEWQPAHFRAHLALAELHQQRFEDLQTRGINPMSLVNIRDAVVRSRFPSAEALRAWLSRAVGPHWVQLLRALVHARQALRACPLEGRAYVCLARLRFLEDGGPSTRACLSQALRVRPFDGGVLYAVASEAYLAGDAARWLAYARQAFHAGRQYQRQLIADFMDHTPPQATPAMIAFLLRNFQPDLEGVRLLASVSTKRCRPEQLVPLLHCWAEMAENQARTTNAPDSAKLWLEAMHVYGQLHDAAGELDCARQAVTSDPNDYQARYELAECLIQRQEFAEAETNLHWCLQRSPNDETVEAKLKEALKGRLDGQRRAATRGTGWR